MAVSALQAAGQASALRHRCAKRDITSLAILGELAALAKLKLVSVLFTANTQVSDAGCAIRLPGTAKVALDILQKRYKILNGTVGVF